MDGNHSRNGNDTVAEPHRLTTEDVRGDYLQTSSWRVPRAEMGEAFDRWLAEYRRQVLEEAAQAAEGTRPEVGPHILSTPRRDGLFDGGTRAAGAIRALAEKGADRG